MNQNQLKEYCLDRLLEMCVKAGVDVARLEPNYREGALVSVTIYRYFQPRNQTINVEGGLPDNDGQKAHYQRALRVKKKSSDVYQTSEP